MVTDRVRLMDEGATDFERVLLDSAAEEMPAPELSKKMLAGLSGVAALGVVSTTTSLAAAKTSAVSVIPWSSILKWGLSGAAAALLSWGGYAFLTEDDAPARAAVMKPAAASWTSPSSPSHRGEEAPFAEPSAISQRVPDSGAASAAPSRAAPSRAVPGRTDPSTGLPPFQQAAEGVSDSASLREELELLDQVRLALKAEQSERALRIVTTYEKKFPRGSLRQEATVLKVEALKARGSEGQAEALTEDFLKENPDSAYKTRLKPMGDQSSQNAP